MDNQQERSILTLDFLAGIIVGEGSYSINVIRPKRGPWELKPCFSLRMNDVETIDRFCESFAAHGLSLYRSANVYKRCHTVRTEGLKRMEAHLSVFLPLLTGNKRLAAQVVSDFTSRRLTMPPKTKYDDVDVDFVAKLREVNGPCANRVAIEILRDHMRRPDMRGDATRHRGRQANGRLLPGKRWSELHGDMQSAAEMTAPQP